MIARSPDLARRALVVALSSLALLAPPAPAEDGSSDARRSGKVPSPAEAERALRVAPGFRVDLFAAEPLVANPVAFHFDERGRFYVVETFRHTDGVTDTRSHMDWLVDDLASRTVADRVAMYRKFFTPEQFAAFGVETERIRLVEDRDGDGKADHATVFAYGFNGPEVGMTFRVERLPYAVLIDQAGRVAAKGLVNSREHLESLVTAHETGFASIQDYLASRPAAE